MTLLGRTPPDMLLMTQGHTWCHSPRRVQTVRKPNKIDTQLWLKQWIFEQLAHPGNFFAGSVIILCRQVPSVLMNINTGTKELQCPIHNLEAFSRIHILLLFPSPSTFSLACLREWASAKLLHPGWCLESKTVAHCRGCFLVFLLVHKLQIKF